MKLSREEINRHFRERESQFEYEIGKIMKPKLPIIINTHDDLAVCCANVITTFLNVIFAEDIGTKE